MATFAHLHEGVVLDPQVNDTIEDYLNRWGDLPKTEWADHVFQEVPEGTEHGANASTFENPKPPEAKKPDFITLDGSGFIALVSGAIGMARLDQLLAKSETVKALLMKAEKIDRNSGNTPAALAYLKTGTNPLTDNEIALLDAAWKSKS